MTADSGVGRAAQREVIAWHALTATEVLTRVGSTPEGLSGTEARKRLSAVGRNELPSAPPRSALRILGAQLRSVIVLLLLVAAGVSLAAGDVIEAVAIGAVLVINASIGFVVELRARRAMTRCSGSRCSAPW